MSRPRAILGTVLLVLVAIGVWLWSRAPIAPEAEEPSTEQQIANLHARALLQIVATQADSADDPELRWLISEVRYLLTRAQVALARPQGPYEAEDGEALFTLRLVEGDPPDGNLTLSLIAPTGEVERNVVIEGQGTDGLGLMTTVARQLPALLPRGDTGAKLESFLGTEDPVAYEALAQAGMDTRGKGEILQSGLTTRDAPVDHLETLTRQHPDFARAWAALALEYLRIAGRDAASLTASAESAARRALVLDEQLAEAHAALGITQHRRGQFLLADTSLSRALALDPASPPALEAFACLLVDVGRIRYATLISEQAVEVAPQSEAAAECLVFAKMATDMPLPVAPEQSDVPSAAQPRALEALMAGRNDEARILLGSAADPVRFNAWFNPVAAAISDPALIADALRALTQAASEATLDPSTEILVGVALRQPDFVFNRLLRLNAQQKAVPARFLWIRQAGYLRGHPRAGAVAETLGLTAYWRERERPDDCLTSPQPAIC